MAPWGGVVNSYALVREGVSDKGTNKMNHKKQIWRLRG